MKLFENYLEGIGKVLSKSPDFIKNFSGKIENSQNSPFMGDVVKPQKIEGPKQLFTFDSIQLEHLFGTNEDSFSEIIIGTHPDFKDLKFDEHCNHHCVSSFIDIKGSTRLALKYDLKIVRLIKDSLLTLCIHVANFFGGHVHRLQGDGVFLQFVRRNKRENDAIINALNATSILAHFVSTSLAQIFEANNIKPLKIRVGIDFGQNDKVLWSHYGIKNCNELTTTSLHTDLAAKLQAKAKLNSIMIGRNIVDTLDLNEAFISYICKDGSEEIDYYILDAEGFRYNQYEFDWRKYLMTYDFVKKNSSGINLEIHIPSFRMECYTYDKDDKNIVKYHQNSKSIRKGKRIRYKLLHNNLEYHQQPYEKIEWYAHNSGKDAEKAGQLSHDFGKHYHNKTYCETDAAYLGHHYVECRIVRQFSDNIRVILPIFVG